MSASEAYAARVDAVVAQRTRLRGPQPPGDLFAALPPDHLLLNADPLRPADPNLAVVASYIEPDDVIVDVGGGAGRYSLPLALHCQKVIDVDPSGAMLAAFERNASQANISNVQTVRGDWLEVEPPRGSLALVNHVTYLTRDIVPFIEKLEVAASRRVLLTVLSPPPPSQHRELFRLVYDETEEIVPGHIELVNVMWEMGIEPDVRMLSRSASSYPASPTREGAIQLAITRFRGEQWALWPLGAKLEGRIREVFEAGFDELFTHSADGYLPTWLMPGREVLITWESHG